LTSNRQQPAAKNCLPARQRIPDNIIPTKLDRFPQKIIAEAFAERMPRERKDQVE